jgi:hypothetical protein
MEFSGCGAASVPASCVIIHAGRRFSTSTHTDQPNAATRADGAKAGIRTDGVRLKNQLRLRSPSRMRARMIEARIIQWHLDDK